MFIFSISNCGENESTTFIGLGCNDVFKELKNYFFLNVKCVLKPKNVIFVKSKNLIRENIARVNNFNPICFYK
jgi:hypothetical protein